MKPRALIYAMVSLATALLLAAPALAGDGGEGLYGKANDKVITNFGFGLMIFFTVLVTGLSLLQRLLDKRKNK
jgi:hypothetical protein